MFEFVRGRVATTTVIGVSWASGLTVIGGGGAAVLVDRACLPPDCEGQTIGDDFDYGGGTADVTKYRVTKTWTTSYRVHQG